jgi:DNA-binding MarR family transcriptional regulator
VEELRCAGFGRLLMRASRRYNEAAMEGVRRRGHPDLTLAHAAVLPHIDIGGSRLTEVAERAGMTKQSASELVAGLERLGYLAREPDPADRRAQRVVFTSRGRDFLLAAFAAKQDQERELAQRLGADGAAEIARLLRAYLDEPAP